MKAKDVQINQVYTIKVAANITGVRIMGENRYGGWDGINIRTNKPIRIRTASRIRGLWKQGGAVSPTPAQVATKGTKPSKDTSLSKEPNGAKRGGLRGCPLDS
jgi:hypothetical protein